MLWFSTFKVGNTSFAAILRYVFTNRHWERQWLVVSHSLYRSPRFFFSIYRCGFNSRYIVWIIVAESSQFVILLWRNFTWGSLLPHVGILSTSASKNSLKFYIYLCTLRVVFCSLPRHISVTSTIFSPPHALVKAVGEGGRRRRRKDLDARHDFISRLLGELCVVS